MNGIIRKSLKDMVILQAKKGKREYQSISIVC